MGTDGGGIPLPIIIGFGFLMLGLVSFSIQMQIRRQRAKDDVARDADDAMRDRALREALRRHPELVHAEDSYSLRELQRRTDEILEEWDVKERRIRAVQSENQQRQAREAREAQRVREAQRRQERLERISASKGIRKFVLKYPAAAFGIGLGVLVIVAVGVSATVSEIQERNAIAQAAQRAQDREEAERLRELTQQRQAEAAAAALEARQQALLDTCDAEEARTGVEDRIVYDEHYEAWAACDDRGLLAGLVVWVMGSDSQNDVHARIASNLRDGQEWAPVAESLAKNARDSRILEQLSTHPEMKVRLFVAQNTATDESTLGVLSEDSNAAVAAFADEQLQ